MQSSWFLVFVFLMARGGPGAKRLRSSARQPEEDVGSEYNPGEDSGRDSDGEDWEAVTTEIRSKKLEQQKGKGKAKDIEQEKGKGKGRGKAKGTVKEKSKGKNIGISIREPTGSPTHDVTIDSKRQSVYASKHCIGERHVGVVNLFEKVPGFQSLYENGNLHEICVFSERRGYGLELVREFYLRAGNLYESDGGPYKFTTTVRGVEMTVTPDTVASVLDMEARTDGVDFFARRLRLY